MPPGRIPGPASLVTRAKGGSGRLASQPGKMLSDHFRLGCGRYPGLHLEQSFLLSFGHSAEVEAGSSQCFPAAFGSGGWYSHSSHSPTGLVEPPPVLPGWATAASSYLHPPGSRISFPATRLSAGHGVTEPQWESGSCPACVALPWPSVQLGTSRQDLAACPQAGCQHVAGGRAPVLAGMCMEVLEMGAG